MKRLLIIVFLVVCSCNNVKTIYNNENPYAGDQPNQPMLKTINATEASKIIVAFTTGFSNDSIILTSKDFVKERVISTMSSIGIAGYEVISNNEDVEIQILNAKIKYRLKKEHMQKYKYIYVSKKERKTLIEYSNNQRKFA